MSPSYILPVFANSQVQAMFLHYFTALISLVELIFRSTYSHYLVIRLVLGNLAFWTHGACIVYPSESFDPVSIVDALSQEKCTALHGVPTHFLGVLSEVERRKSRGEMVNLSNLRYVTYSCIYLTS